MLLGREEDAARFICDGCVYSVELVPARILKSFPAQYTAGQWHHVNLIFTYDAASRASWDEAAASYDDIRGRCGNGSVPFTTLLLAMGLPDPPIPEAAALASQRACLAAECSPTTGRGICNAFASLVEHAHAAGPKVPPGARLAVDTSSLLHVLFSEFGA